MAHFVLEYSDNIDAASLALQRLFEQLHDCARDSGIFPYKGIRSRAYVSHDYRIADGNPNHMFVHLTVLVGAGRSVEERETVAKQFFAILQRHFSHCLEVRGVALSFELKELEPLLKYNLNNIQNYLAAEPSA